MDEQTTRLHRDIAAAEGPIYRRLMEALKKCRSARHISQCIEAYGHLIDTERDAVMQRHGYPSPVLLCHALCHAVNRGVVFVAITSL